MVAPRAPSQRARARASSSAVWTRADRGWKNPSFRILLPRAIKAVAIKVEQRCPIEREKRKKS